ncbi:UPF0691 protein C9orf116 homolog [Rhopalosiphum maidis]|uniref:UPF0691 protein C9orf116 homolog n=1 Tax=Rhopalosiphum maidis TaxID=43146 RepID=UPI000EFF43DB|nr:UPF0691 protein C9orf116 homolog [Rhopalosiphum maidis]
MDNRDGSSGGTQEKTSDFYKTHNLPTRFEYPGLQNYSKTRRTPTNLFYATTYNDYGYFPPTVHTARKCYHGKSQRFGQEQFIRGMYRDHSLNM